VGQPVEESVAENIHLPSVGLIVDHHHHQYLTRLMTNLQVSAVVLDALPTCYNYDVHFGILTLTSISNLVFPLAQVLSHCDYGVSLEILICCDHGCASGFEIEHLAVPLVAETTHETVMSVLLWALHNLD
jgi:hypothetical protein